jgi:probable selenium-dependent hydroxylase accessory protein YqeC
MKPASLDAPNLLIDEDESRLVNTVLKEIGKRRHITAASSWVTESKLQGISPEAIEQLAGRKAAPYIIVEADGARNLPLKAPGPDEPVIPIATTLVVPVIGIDALDRPLTEENVFRADVAAALLDLLPGTIVTTREIARLVAHPEGLAKGSPASASIVPFINKLDTNSLVARGRELAHRILEMKHPAIERVVLGHTAAPTPVVEVIFQQ